MLTDILLETFLLNNEDKEKKKQIQFLSLALQLLST